MNLTTIVKQDIEAWLNAHSEILANERDLQVCLALALREKGLYDKVHLEYRIPMTLLKDKLMKKGILAKKLRNEQSEVSMVELCLLLY